MVYFIKEARNGMINYINLKAIEIKRTEIWIKKH